MRYMKTLTVEQVRKILRRKCQVAGSIRTWAITHKVTAVYVSDVLGGSRKPGPAILRALSIEKVVGYRLIKPEKKD